MEGADPEFPIPQWVRLLPIPAHGTSDRGAAGGTPSLWLFQGRSSCPRRRCSKRQKKHPLGDDENSVGDQQFPEELNDENLQPEDDKKRVVQAEEDADQEPATSIAEEEFLWMETRRPLRVMKESLELDHGTCEAAEMLDAFEEADCAQAIGALNW